MMQGVYQQTAELSYSMAKGCRAGRSEREGSTQQRPCHALGASFGSNIAQVFPAGAGMKSKMRKDAVTGSGIQAVMTISVNWPKLGLYSHQVTVRHECAWQQEQGDGKSTEMAVPFSTEFQPMAANTPPNFRPSLQSCRYKKENCTWPQTQDGTLPALQMRTTMKCFFPHLPVKQLGGRGQVPRELRLPLLLLP